MAALTTAEGQSGPRETERVLVTLLELERELLELRYVRRADALERAGEAVRRLGEMTATDGMLARAASELGNGSEFGCVLISEVDQGELRPLALWSRDDPAATEAWLAELRVAPIRLQYPLLEHEVAQERGARLVDVAVAGARTPRPLADRLGWSSYVVAAVSAGGETIGLLHADDRDRTLDDVDLQVAARYADGLGGAFERAVLRHTLQLHRAELSSAVRWLGTRVEHLGELEGASRPGNDALGGGARGLIPPGARMLSSLTPRELEVLRLLARGMTNLAIGNALVVREGTVKYHVKNILRKLGATSRADAVARYVRAAAETARVSRLGGSARVSPLGGSAQVSPLGGAAQVSPLAASARPAGAPPDGLGQRLAQATAQAQALLSQEPVAAPPGGDASGQRPAAAASVVDASGQEEQLRVLIDSLSERLASQRGGDAGRSVREHAAARERLHVRFAARFDALERAHRAVDELRALTSPPTMLLRAPEALCAASSFERALLSLVGEGQMLAETAHFSGDPAGGEAALARLRAHPLALEHPLTETEMLRRRRATIVADAPMNSRVDPEWLAVMGWRSYAAAPLVVGATVVGVLHGDRGRNRDLDVLDRDVLWEFASALAHAYESASLRRALRREREQMRRFLDWLGARSGELTDAPIRLATVARSPRFSPGEAAPPSPGRDDRAVFEGLLTRRELDVLRLLAEGHSNRRIAEALVISDGTVKFHVNGILRKLRVANRAQAVSRYLRLLGMRAP